METWQLQQAKSRFSELVKCAQMNGPQGITLRGEPVAVLLSQAQYQRLSQPKMDFVAFMRNSPMAGLELDLDTSRLSDTEREIAL